jgi:hypothetical protein
MGKLSVEARVDKHDREIAAIEKLILTGMKMIVERDKRWDRHYLKMEGELAAFRRDMRELAAAQKVTEKKLQGLIDALARGTNGHP